MGCKKAGGKGRGLFSPADDVTASVPWRWLVARPSVGDVRPAAASDSYGEWCKSSTGVYSSMHALECSMLKCL
jgi:hypothetical protein